MKWYIFCQTATPLILCDDLPMMSCDFMLDCHIHQTLSLGRTVKTYLYDVMWFFARLPHPPNPIIGTYCDDLWFKSIVC